MINSTDSFDTNATIVLNSGTHTHPPLVPDSINFHITENVTVSDVLYKAVDALDQGPNILGDSTAMAMAVSTPILVLLCLGLMRSCRKRPCCGGQCFYCWFNCTGCCMIACGGEHLISGTEPATGLEPDEDVNDPDVILGDEDHRQEEGTEMTEEMQEDRPRSSASECSDEEDEARGSDTSYDRSCKQCCDTVAACLENGDGDGHSNGNGGCRGPAIEAVKASQRNGKSGKRR